ncbi:16S rRNA (cytosine(967)-C(5))-methyltransferase RsmB [Paenibacillus sp. CAU 1782]
MSRPARPRQGGNGQQSNPRSGKAALGTPREAALTILVRVATSGAYSNLQINKTLQEAGLSRSDAGLATELVYGTISRQATLDYWLERFVAKGLGKLQTWVHQLLRLSAYQLLYLDRVPTHAAVNEAVEIAKRRGHGGIAGMVNGVLRSIDRNRAELKPELINLPGEAETIALRHSYPLWLVERWIAQFGLEAAEAICASSNEAPHAGIRVNPLAASVEDVLAELSEAGLEGQPSSLTQSGIAVSGGGNLTELAGYIGGRWSLQDESSMLVAEVVAPRPGMKVLDCCAAPGGKSCHLAELMEGKGKVWANDLHAHKRKIIAAQTERLKLRNVEATTGDALKLGEIFAPASMDAVLLDAPCSGFGVIRRKPEIKWTKTAGDVSDIAAIQRSLLDAVSDIVKPGGTFVYSTCTMLREENEEQIERFLNDHPQFELDAQWPEPLLKRLTAAGLIDESFQGQLQLLPHHFGSDGFFIARMKRRL